MFGGLGFGVGVAGSYSIGEKTHEPEVLMLLAGRALAWVSGRNSSTRTGGL